MPDAFMPYNRRDPQFQYVANANWTKGTHNIRFGVDYYQMNMNHLQPEFSGANHGAQGGFSFTGGPTQNNGGASATEFNSWGAFMLGTPNNYGRLLQVDGLTITAQARALEDAVTGAVVNAATWADDSWAN
jgi:hypothetical protein